MRIIDWLAISLGAVTMFGVGFYRAFPLVDLVALTGAVTALLYSGIATFRSIRQDGLAYRADLQDYMAGRMDIDTVLRRIGERKY